MINSKNVYTLTELQAEAAKDGFYLEFDFRPTTDLSGGSVRGTFAARFVPMGYEETPTRNVAHHVCGAMGFNPMLGDSCPKCDESRANWLRNKIAEDVEESCEAGGLFDMADLKRAVAEMEDGDELIEFKHPLDVVTEDEKRQLDDIFLKLQDLAAPEGEYEKFVAEQAFDKSMKDVL